MIRNADNSSEPIDAAAAPSAACDPGAPGGCSICGDEALPARVLSVDARTRTASVAFLADGIAAAGRGGFGGVIAAALDLVDGVAAGDVVLVHQAFVISRVGAP